MAELYFLIPFVIALALCLCAMPSVISIGHKYQWVDIPDKRKHHQHPIVRVGGIAMIIGVTIAGLVSIFLQPELSGSPMTMSLVAIVIGSLCFFGIGFADDILQLPPLPRLVFQVCVASFVWSLGVRIEYLPIPFLGAISLGFLSLPITIIWIAGVANAINWFDGLDGLAAGVGGLSALILAVTAILQGHYEIASLAFALCGATLGFLRFNLPPAKLFMGDGGSYLIGFNLAALGALGFMNTQTMTSTLVPFLILGVPVIDMTLVMTSRIAQRKSPLYPDRRHLHHRLLASGATKMFATGYIWALSSWVGCLAIVISNPAWGWSCLITVSLILLVMTFNLRQVIRAMKLKAFYQS